MTLPPSSQSGTSLIALEAAFTLFAITLAYVAPGLGNSVFSRLQPAMLRIAHRRRLAVAVVIATALVTRLAILPLSPIPHPFIADGFSYLLAADTYCLGRLTNPTPAMWTHFETFQVTMLPTYMSMYFPAHGMVLAFGKAVLGAPWYGLLLVNSLLCGAICWALQEWVSPGWAFVGGLIAVMRIGLFSYWINSYSGGGAIAALGGALVIGALPRVLADPSVRNWLVMTTGAVILANSRPYEGILLCIPVVYAIGHWMLRSEQAPPATVLLRRAAPSLAVLTVAVCAMGYYNHRVFGNALIEPYHVSRATYAVAPHFVWQSPHPEPKYRYAVMKDFYTGWELDEYKRLHSVKGFFSETFLKLIRAILFYLGIALLPVLFMTRRMFRNPGSRFLLACLGVLAAGMLMETWLIPHYLSPFTAVFYALLAQSMRLMWERPAGRPFGQALVRNMITVCFILTGMRAFAQPLHLKLATWPTWTWFGGEGFGADRVRVEEFLEHQPGKQLAIVRYAPNHNSIDEWVYNAADVDKSPVIWAREMGGTGDQELVEYYKDRRVWLIEPDREPITATPYVAPEMNVAVAR